MRKGVLRRQRGGTDSPHVVHKGNKVVAGTTAWPREWSRIAVERSRNPQRGPCGKWKRRLASRETILGRPHAQLHAGRRRCVWANLCLRNRGRSVNGASGALRKDTFGAAANIAKGAVPWKRDDRGHVSLGIYISERQWKKKGRSGQGW